MVWGCSHRDAATAPVAAATGVAADATKPASADLAGRWKGEATIVVNWTNQKQLPVCLVIAGDGSVRGTVGDAKLVNARLNGKAFLQNRDYRVHGDLEGNLIDAEQVHRDGVDILFDRTDEGLSGGLHSTGSEFGGKNSMKLSAFKMVLKREEAK